MEPLKVPDLQRLFDSQSSAGRADVELVFKYRSLALLVEADDMGQCLHQYFPFLRPSLPYAGSSGLSWANPDHCLPPCVLWQPPSAESPREAHQLPKLQLPYPRQHRVCWLPALFLGWVLGPCGAQLLDLILARGMGQWRGHCPLPASLTQGVGAWRSMLLSRRRAAFLWGQAGTGVCCPSKCEAQLGPYYSHVGLLGD